MQTQVEDSVKPTVDPHDIDPKLVQKLAYDALVWCSLRGLLVGDRNSKVSLYVNRNSFYISEKEVCVTELSIKSSDFVDLFYHLI